MSLFCFGPKSISSLWLLHDFSGCSLPEFTRTWILSLLYHAGAAPARNVGTFHPRNTTHTVRWWRQLMLDRETLMLSRMISVMLCWFLRASERRVNHEPKKQRIEFINLSKEINHEIWFGVDSTTQTLQILKKKQMQINLIRNFLRFIFVLKKKKRIAECSELVQLFRSLIWIMSLHWNVPVC